MAEVKLKETTFENTKLNVVPLNWKEVYYTNCPLVSASNVDQELGWTREEYKKIGVKYAFLFYLDVEDTYEGIRHIDMVPNLSPQNLASVEIGKNFMLSHGYIKKDFDVHAWAAPEFLETAAKELLAERWQKVTTAKLPETSVLQATTRRIG